MKKIKKLTVGLLACMLATSTAVSSYGNVNGTGDGEVNGTSTPEIAGSFHAYHVNQGTRMTIVNAEGIAVSNSVDFVNYFPEDIATGIGLSSEDINYMWSNYKENTGSDRNVPKKYIQYLGGCKTDIVYALSIPCLLDKSTATEQEKALDANKHGLMTITRKNNDYTRKGSFIGNFAFQKSKMYTYSLLEKMLNRDAEKLGYTNPMDGSTGTFSYTTSTGEQRTVSKRFKPPIIEGTTSTGASGLLTTGEEMKKQLMAPVEYINSNGEKVSSNMIERIVELNGYDVNGRGNKISNNLVRVFEYIDPKLESQYDELHENNAGSKMSTVFKANNLKLLIEPISWMVGGVSSPTDPRPDRQGVGMEMSFNTPYVVYGTVTNAYQYIAKQFNIYCERMGLYKDKPSMDDWSTWIDWTNAKGIGFSWEWGLHTKGYRIENDEIALGLTSFNPETQNTLQNLLRNYLSLGYGVMVTTLDELGVGTPTWDSQTYPESNYQPAPAPDKSSIQSEGDDYKKATYPDGTVKDKNFNIVKFYGTKDSSGNYTYTDNYTRQQTLHTINLNDEPAYKVDDYFTSSQFKKPSSKTDSYDDFKSTLPKGEFNGTESGQIVVTPESTTNTLYMRLIEDNSVGEGDADVKIPLYENEISKQVSLSAISDPVSLKVTNTLPSVPSDIDGSRHKEQFRPEGEQGWKAWYNYHNPSLSGADSELIAKTAPFEIVYSGLSSGTRTASRGGTMSVPQDFNAKFSIWRGMDKPTIADYKPEESGNVKSELKALGLPESNTPQYSRGRTGQLTDISGVITGMFNSQFEVNKSESKLNIDTEQRTRDGYWDEWECSDEDCSGHEEWEWYDWTSWSHYSTEHGTENTTTLAKMLVNVYYYLGATNLGTKQATDDLGLEFRIPTKTMGGGTELDRVFSGKGTAVATSKPIVFYPYTQMRYNTTQNSDWKNVYTLSNFESVIHNTDYVDLAYSKKNRNSLELNSTQWSTHARSIKAVGKDNALPGGALHNLSTPDKNNTQIALRIFQTVTPDSLEPVLKSGYEYYNSLSARARRDDLVSQVTESLSNLTIEQHIVEGITKDIKELGKGTIVKSTGNQKVFKNTTSTDSKYFFKFAKTQADGGALNIKKSDDITEAVYRASSSIDGTVKIYKDNAEILSLSKAEDITKILSNPELKELDDKTKFFTNFLLAIDRNAGSDDSGQKWYNEALDTLELHVYTQVFTIGFTEPFSTRSSVLDPKLIGYQESKSDLYNYEDESKVRSSVYLTSDRPTNQTSLGVLAKWGDNNINILIPRLSYVFQSKIFYIPNATVHDLN